MTYGRIRRSHEFSWRTSFVGREEDEEWGGTKLLRIGNLNPVNLTVLSREEEGEQHEIAK